MGPGTTATAAICLSASKILFILSLLFVCLRLSCSAQHTHSKPWDWGQSGGRHMREGRSLPPQFRSVGESGSRDNPQKRHRKQTRPCCFGTAGSSWFVLTMYSPQSLHRWGITHSESMERLAYSQGRLSYCLPLIYPSTAWKYFLKAGLTMFAMM